MSSLELRSSGTPRFQCYTAGMETSAIPCRPPMPTSAPCMLRVIWLPGSRLEATRQQCGLISAVKPVNREEHDHQIDKRTCTIACVVDVKVRIAGNGVIGAQGSSPLEADRSHTRCLCQHPKHPGTIVFAQGCRRWLHQLLL